MRKQLSKTFLELGADKNFAVLIGDISHFALRDFQAQYPDRFYNMGIAEQSMIGMASGMAMKGFFPVVHTIAPFITERALEQIKDDLCYQELGVNLVSIGAAFDYAALGCTHHCYDDFAILRAQPNMQVVYPGASHEFDALFKQAYNNGSPTYFRLSEHEHKIATSPVFGEAEKIKEGEHITIIVAGPQLQNAFEAVEEVAHEGVSCDLIYLTTIKPISEKSKEMIRASLKKTGKLITIEEHSIIGGVADAISLVAKDVPFVSRRIGIQDVFLTHYGTYEEHCQAIGLTKQGVINIIHEIQR
jgi:transketolase